MFEHLEFEAIMQSMLHVAPNVNIKKYDEKLVGEIER